MLQRINTPDDVVDFAKQLVEEGLNFHPDDDFNDYVNVNTNEPSYTPQEAELRNKLMSQCFDVCEKNGMDVYDIMCEVMLTETGLDSLIPLPSAVLAE